MDFSSVRRLALELNLAAHGLDVLVTRPGEAGIETRGIWLTPVTEDFPGNTDFARREPRRVMALSRAEVGTVPRGTIIRAPEQGCDDERDWKVDGTDRIEADNVRVSVVPVDEE